MAIPSFASLQAGYRNEELEAPLNPHYLTDHQIVFDKHIRDAHIKKCVAIISIVALSIIAAAGMALAALYAPIYIPIVFVISGIFTSITHSKVYHPNIEKSKAFKADAAQERNLIEEMERVNQLNDHKLETELNRIARAPEANHRKLIPMIAQYRIWEIEHENLFAQCEAKKTQILGADDNEIKNNLYSQLDEKQHKAALLKMQLVYARTILINPTNQKALTEMLTPINLSPARRLLDPEFQEVQMATIADNTNSLMRNDILNYSVTQIARALQFESQTQ